VDHSFIAISNLCIVQYYTHSSSCNISFNPTGGAVDFPPFVNFGLRMCGLCCLPEHQIIFSMPSGVGTKTSGISLGFARVRLLGSRHDRG
jgi:hypothetical protein